MMSGWKINERPGTSSVRIHSLFDTSNNLGDYAALWQYRLWSFRGRNTKLERFLAKNQLLSNETIEFCELA